MHNLDELVELVENWAADRGILDASSVVRQLDKTSEEMNELQRAIGADDYDGASDAFGDILVTLIIAARMYGVNLTNALNDVYTIISARKGSMQDGLFVKEAA